MNTSKILTVAFVLVMVAVVVIVDFLFFKDRFVMRLFVNIAIVAVCVAIYLRFFK